MANPENNNGITENTHTNQKRTLSVKKTGKKVCASALSVFLGVAAVICLFVMAQVLAHGYVSVAGHSMFRVVTGSMEPEIPIGSLLISEKTDISTLSEGDIVCFRSREPGMFGQIITHRIIGILTDENNNLLLRTKGDANNSEDGYFVTKDNLVGKVIWHTGDDSFMASIFSVLTNKIGFLSIIVIPVLLVAAIILKENINSIRKELKEAIDELDKNAATRDSQTEKEPPISEEEYQEMYERIKAQLLEELSEGATMESTPDKEAGEGETE